MSVREEIEEAAEGRKLWLQWGGITRPIFLYFDRISLNMPVKIVVLGILSYSLNV